MKKITVEDFKKRTPEEILDEMRTLSIEKEEVWQYMPVKVYLYLKIANVHTVADIVLLDTTKTKCRPEVESKLREFMITYGLSLLKHKLSEGKPVKNTNTNLTEEKQTKDTNVDLREDDFLFPDGYELTEHIRNRSLVSQLKIKGIHTIEQLINCKASDFSYQSRWSNMALIQILRHKYLGEEIINDVLLEKKYDTNFENVAREIAVDLYKLGLTFNRYRSHARNVDRIEFFVRNYIEENNLVGQTISMEYLLKARITWVDKTISLLGPASGDSDFLGYYLSYIEKKQHKEQLEDEMPPKEVLEGLKYQLQVLINARDGIDKQILEVQEQIKNLGGGQSKNGSK